MSTTSKPNEESNKQDSSSITNWSNNSYVELENQFILRMPVIKQENGTSKLHPAGLALREALAKAAAFNSKADDSPIDPLKDRLFININPETRKGQVKFDDDVFEARLVDLPCIIESLKTTDKKMFYKTADICQMLVCKTKDEPFSGDEDEASQKVQKKSSNSNQLDYVNPLLKKYQWPHGVTAPLKNVRRKRFRKIAKKKVIDYAEIEKEVKHLFRADREALKIDYEIAYVEGDTDDEENKTKDEDFDDSSADESAPLKSSCMKESSAKAGAAKKYSKAKAESNFKSKSIIEESNLSSAEDMDYDSSMMLKTDRNDDEATNPNPKTSKYDELSNENSNVGAAAASVATSSATADKKNNRTNFKNLFVKQVIGDLSSSSNDSENTDMDDEDEEDEAKRRAKVKSSAPPPPPPSGLFGEESMSNFDEAKAGGLSNEDSMSNLETAAKTKSLLNDTNNDEDSDEYQDEEDLKVSANNLDIEDSSSNLNKKANEDFLSASSVSNMDNETSDKVEYRNRLNELNSELNKKREQIRQQENQINQIPNPMLRKRFEEMLNNLMDEKRKMMDEIEQVRALLDN
jgi:TATA-binding protein-associated factor Taf7